MSRLAGSVAFVTGAARGMGRSHCVRMAQEGADIIAVDLVQAAGDLAETADLVRNLGRRATTAIADVRDPAALEAAVSDGVAEFGRLDVIVANAGIYADLAPSWELSEAAWRRTLDINLTGVWHTVRAAVPHLSGGGSVVIVSSTNGLKGGANTAHYSASKHAVVGLARTLANELGERGIRVNTVHPGAVGTAMIRNAEVFAKLLPDIESPSEEDAVALFAAKNLLPVPWVDPVDVSNAVLFLASGESRYVTGTQMVVDAGLTQKVM
ncbi:mycofactocin-coupled SDR family oxidoreductase [Antrihabitans sp. YC2-6]|uniref:mycofactocin-coupled SDR family oxidoreductase n=1 Tax=Antrihabitans sp. YC2-6 TaxID=2799498 RepID=UPI0018F6C1F2|nr:mycofactocin-coupled SDR family oxidoreductase [Antrihabitans sp. YC2-6]MBJ8344699.1 mycofactocin-coupled SDR family oxidoreductase [Antrihabitans sp. YC2-6]